MQRLRCGTRIHRAQGGLNLSTYSGRFGHPRESNTTNTLVRQEFCTGLEIDSRAFDNGALRLANASVPEPTWGVQRSPERENGKRNRHGWGKIAESIPADLEVAVIKLKKSLLELASLVCETYVSGYLPKKDPLSVPLTWYFDASAYRRCDVEKWWIDIDNCRAKSSRVDKKHLWEGRIVGVGWQERITGLEDAEDCENLGYHARSEWGGWRLDQHLVDLANARVRVGVGVEHRVGTPGPITLLAFISCQCHPSGRLEI